MTEKAKVSIDVHPAATLLDMMPDNELSQLADDIAANGLFEPIVIYQGQLLDGRNRLKACELADVEPRFVELEEIYSPTAYVASKNVHRRHLTISQRAGFAADAVPHFEREARERQAWKSNSIENKDDSSFPPQGGKVEPYHATKEAAKAMKVGERTVERALEVKRKAPELHERVKRGEMSVGEASRKIPKTRQRGGQQPKDITTNRGRQIAEAHKRRMIDCFSMINGMCRGIENKDIDVNKIALVCSKEEIETWSASAESSARILRKFANNLREATNAEKSSD